MIKIINFLFCFVKSIFKGKESARRVLYLEGPLFFKKIVAKKFLTRNNELPFTLHEDWINYLKILRRDGVVVISDNFFKSQAETIFITLKKYNIDSWKNNNEVIDYCFDLGFAFPGIIDLMSHDQLCKLFYAYYGRQAYYREHPEVIAHSTAKKPRSSEFIHKDGYRQLSCFLMLSEMNEDTSQLSVFLGSHKEVGFNLERNSSSNTDSLMQTSINAKFGDLIIFDSGSLWHFGKSRSIQRIILNFILTTGWMLPLQSDKYDSDFLFHFLKNKEEITKNTFNGFF
jgi:hypothetical protein